jgi:hypothetical protein
VALPRAPAYNRKPVHFGRSLVKTYPCICGNTLHFENSRCLACGRLVGFLPDARSMAALDPEREGVWRARHPQFEGWLYRQCANYAHQDVCNWMVPHNDPNPLCASCRLSQVIPNLDSDRNRVLWYRIEGAKRRLLYTLMELGLPVVGKSEDPERGLSFQFLEDEPGDLEFYDDVSAHRHVMTGHRLGVITINVAEADASAREEMRERMREGYRTLLGHFRHESGHFYWDWLVRDTGWREDFRSLFGDESADYDSALSRYYSEGPARSWQRNFVSAYASAHPWEDWAETWAHFLHMVDTLETANDFGFAIRGRELVMPDALLKPGAQHASGFFARSVTFDHMLDDWISLTVALNGLNRSMGLPDAYPFTPSGTAMRKLEFVFRVISDYVSRA